MNGIGATHGQAEHSNTDSPHDGKSMEGREHDGDQRKEKKPGPLVVTRPPKTAYCPDE
jgi:hypothetical protein